MKLYRRATRCWAAGPAWMDACKLPAADMAFFSRLQIGCTGLAPSPVSDSAVLDGSHTSTRLAQLVPPIFARGVCACRRWWGCVAGVVRVSPCCRKSAGRRRPVLFCGRGPRSVRCVGCSVYPMWYVVGKVPIPVPYHIHYIWHILLHTGMVSLTALWNARSCVHGAGQGPSCRTAILQLCKSWLSWLSSGISHMGRAPVHGFTTALARRGRPLMVSRTP